MRQGSMNSAELAENITVLRSIINTRSSINKKKSQGGFSSTQKIYNLQELNTSMLL